MNSKATKWGTRQYKLQVYLSADVKAALDRYMAKQYASDSRVISATVRRALTEFLEKEGCMEHHGGEQ